MLFDGVIFDTTQFVVGGTYDVVGEYTHFKKVICITVSPNEIVFGVQNKSKSGRIEHISIRPGCGYQFEYYEDEPLWKPVSKPMNMSFDTWVTGGTFSEISSTGGDL